MRIYVDCSSSGQNQEWQTRYGVTGYPTVVFLDSEGEQIEPLGSREAGPVREQIERIAREHSRAPLFSESVEDGIAAARENGKLLAVVFVHPADSENLRLFALLGTAGQEDEPFSRFRWIRRPTVGDDNRGTEEARAWGVRSPPTVVLIDPWAEGDDRVLSRERQFNASFRRALDRAAETASGRGHPEAATGESP